MRSKRPFNLIILIKCLIKSELGRKFNLIHLQLQALKVTLREIVRIQAIFRKICKKEKLERIRLESHIQSDKKRLFRTLKKLHLMLEEDLHRKQDPKHRASRRQPTSTSFKTQFNKPTSKSSLTTLISLGTPQTHSRKPQRIRPIIHFKQSPQSPSRPSLTTRTSSSTYSRCKR